MFDQQRDGEENDPPFPEPDPETDLADPERELPSVPETPTFEDADVPQELATSFWYLVVVFNASILALGVGAMFVGFEGNWDLGGRLLAAGGILFVYGLYKYRTNPYREGVPDETATPDGADSDPDADEGDADPSPSAGTTAEADGDGETAPDGEPGDERREVSGTVRGPDGDRYLLVKRSEESSLVRDPETGEETHLPSEELTVEGTALEAAATAVPGAARRVLSATQDDRSLGLLVEVVDHGPVAVRTLLGEYDLCESDLHGLLAEFRAAGLVEETTVLGERGYRATDVAVEGVEHLRSGE